MNDSRAYASAMQALQKKAYYIEEDNGILQRELQDSQLKCQELYNELMNKEELFQALESKLKDTIQQQDEMLATKDAEIESLNQELHASLLDQSRIIDSQVQDRQTIQDQQEQINKLKSVIRKLKEPTRSDTKQSQSDKKTTFQSKLDDTVDIFFQSARRSNIDDQDNYHALIRRIKKLEDEIYYLERDSNNRVLVDEKILVLRDLQAQEESFLQTF